MALDRQFLAPMLHQMTVEPFVGMSTDGYGERVYGTAVTFNARIEFKSTIVKDATGREVVSKTRVFAPPYDVNGTTASISVSDKITLPSGFALRQPPILSVEPHYDHEGPHHIEVYL